MVFVSRRTMTARSSAAAPLDATFGAYFQDEKERASCVLKSPVATDERGEYEITPPQEGNAILSQRGPMSRFEKACIATESTPPVPLRLKASP